MGKHIAPIAAAAMRRTLLELGGNNGVIVMDDADPELVVRAVLFGAVGTAGQRCTSIRRLFLQKSIAPRITERLLAAYKSLRHSATSDPEPVVRLAAVFSLDRNRYLPETMLALKTIADKDASPLVQRGVKLVLSGNLKRGEAVRAVENPESFMQLKPPTEGLEF